MKRTFLSVGLTLSQVQTMSSNFLFQSVYLSFPFPSSYAPSIWNFDVSTLGPMPFRSVKFSHSVVSDSLQLHELQHSRPPCPSPIPGVHSHSCPSSRWCHPAFSSSVVPFSSCPQSLPASESFPMSQLFEWGGQSIGVSIFITNTLDWSDLAAAAVQATSSLT